MRAHFRLPALAGSAEPSLAARAAARSGPPRARTTAVARRGVVFRSAAAGRLPGRRGRSARPPPPPGTESRPPAAAGRRRLSPRPPSAGDAAPRLPGDPRRASLTSERGDVRPRLRPRCGSATLRQRASRESGRAPERTPLVCGTRLRAHVAARRALCQAAEATGSRPAGRRAAAENGGAAFSWTRPRARCGQRAGTPGPAFCAEGRPRRVTGVPSSHLRS